MDELVLLMGYTPLEAISSERKLDSVLDALVLLLDMVVVAAGLEPSAVRGVGTVAFHGVLVLVLFFAWQQMMQQSHLVVGTSVDHRVQDTDSTELPPKEMKLVLHHEIVVP